MIETRTLLFANAVVFAVLAVAMVLVWRSNPRFPGLASLARVHLAMMPGAFLIGLKPGLVPAAVSAIAGNTLVILGLVWLLQGIERLYGRPRDGWAWIVTASWGAGFLFFLYVQPSLRARILLTSLATVALLSKAVWAARSGLQKAGDRAPSLLILGSLGLLAIVFAARCVYMATAADVVNPIGTDVLTQAMVTVSLVSATGWTFGVMNLVYARLNEMLSRDLTERKRYEAALEELVQVAAHELRTPLTSIHGSLKLLTARAIVLSDPDKERLLEMAERNSERMVRLLNDLLDLERIESGRVPFAFENIDLEPLLQQAWELSEEQARRYGIAIERSLPPGARVCANPQRLLQVLSNLLSNAVKFSPPGETVRVSVSEAAGWVRVEISDRGPGIPEEFRSRIFQRFARAAAAGISEARKQGSGLGLAISKALVEGMGGRIGFETAGRTGTTFYCELPAACPAREKTVIAV